jgi:hypothetical protein
MALVRQAESGQERGADATAARRLSVVTG